jgi:hypothetical protein
MGIIDKVKLPFKKVKDYASDFITSDEPGIVHYYRIFAQNTKGSSNQRIDKADKVYLSIKRDLVDKEKSFKTPKKIQQILEENSYKTQSQGSRLKLTIDRTEYTLEPVNLYGSRQSEDRKRLYEIKGYHENSKKQPLAIWIDESGNICREENTQNAGKAIQYYFQGQVSAFSYADRNHRTGNINILTSLITIPTGIVADAVKYVGYKVPDLLLARIPKMLDRLVLPVFSVCVFLPAFLILKPISFLLPRQTKDSINKFFSTDLIDANKSAIQDGLFSYIKNNVLNAATIDVEIKAMEDNVLPFSASTYAKKRCIQVLDILPKTMSFINLSISNVCNITSCYLKGACNLLLFAAHAGDRSYLDSAKFLFTEPFKIVKTEFSESLLGKSSFATASNPDNTRQKITFFSDDGSPASQSKSNKANLHYEAGKSGKALKSAGFNQFDKKQSAVNYPLNYPCFKSQQSVLG